MMENKGNRLYEYETYEKPDADTASADILIHLDKADRWSDNRTTYCGIRINQTLDQTSKYLNVANCRECITVWNAEMMKKWGAL